MITKRLFDLILASCFLVFLTPFFIFAAVFIKISSEGPIFFVSKRCGKDGIVFNFLKFRTMNVGAPLLASHAINAPQYLTRIGKFLRKTSLDEIPQLWNVLRGEMTLVGPRPVIPAETDLIESRRALGIDRLLPGITGWAQINGRDHLSVPAKVAFDYEYMQKQSFWFDLKIILITVRKVLFVRDISH